MIMLVSTYKITVKEEPEFANETFEERKARILASKPGVTMACAQFGVSSLGYRADVWFSLCRPIRVPLVFTKRE